MVIWNFTVVYPISIAGCGLIRNFTVLKLAYSYFRLRVNPELYSKLTYSYFRLRANLELYSTEISLFLFQVAG